VSERDMPVSGVPVRTLAASNVVSRSTTMRIA
jgi:hypothetical protein